MTEPHLFNLFALSDSMPTYLHVSDFLESFHPSSISVRFFLFLCDYFVVSLVKLVCLIYFITIIIIVIIIIIVLFF